MTLAPHVRSTAADLLRLACAWLAAILLVQGIAAAHALGSGPLHRHRDVGVAVHHDHRHDSAERHHHAALDLSVVAAAPDAGFDSAAFALTAALALMALGAARITLSSHRHVLRATARWAWHVHVPAPLLKPPRPG